MKIVIVGNGILALTTALRLANRIGSSGEIVIVGKTSRPGSATLAAAAMLNSFAELEDGALLTDIDRFRFEVSRLATRMWPQFLRDHITPAADCHALGTYLVNNTSADGLDDANFSAVLAALREYGEPYAEADPLSIPNYHPQSRHRALRAIHIPSEGWVNPRIVADALDATLARCSGVSFVDDEVRRLVPSGSAIDHVVLGSGACVAGDEFLLASGATTSDLLDASELGLSIPRVFYGVGVSIEIRSPDSPHTKCIRTPNRGLACGLYTVPYSYGTAAPSDSLLLGSSNLISPVPHEHGRVGAVQALLASAMEQINSEFYRASIARINVGWRPTSADTYPILGRTSIGNLVIASGTRRDGFHLSPVLSNVLASMVLGEATDSRFDCFRPERKLIRTLSRAQAVRSGVNHMMSGAYQHGFVPPNSRMPAHLRQMYTDDLERLHDTVGAFEWGIPPELIDMYRYGHISGADTGAVLKDAR